MPDLLDQLFAMYRVVFPANERRDESDLRSALSTSDYRLVTKMQDDRLIGFAILFIPTGRDFGLLEYLAVDAGRRGEGVGRELVMNTIEQTGGRHLLTEIESQSDDPATRRRQQFYSRRQFRKIDGLRYQLPLPGNPPPMELWVHHHAQAPVDPGNLACWLTAIYTEVYHCRDRDPRIAQMLNLPA